MNAGWAAAAVRAAVFCVLIGAAPPPGAAREGEADVLSARFWMERAAELLESDGLSAGRIAEAAAALDTALEFVPAGPDYWYLRALTVLHAGSAEAAPPAGAVPAAEAGMPKAAAAPAAEISEAAEAGMPGAAAAGAPGVRPPGAAAPAGPFQGGRPQQEPFPLNRDIGFVREAYNFARRGLSAEASGESGFDSAPPPPSPDASSFHSPSRSRAAAAASPPLVPFGRRALLFAELSLRLKEYRGYLEAYDGWPPGEIDDPGLLYAAARSALYLGLDERAAALARRGEALSSPGDSLSGFGARFTHPRSEFRALAAAAGNEEAIAGLPSARRRWGEALEGALEPWILSGRIPLNPGDALNSLIHPELLGAGLHLAGVPPAEAPLMPRRYFSDLSLARKFFEHDELTERFAGFTGTLLEDTNYDGFPEERIEMVNGRPMERRIDTDQDGLDEWEILYDGGEPVRIRVNPGPSGGRLTVNYDAKAYPEVISMVSRDSPITGDAFFPPGRFSWDPSDGGVTFGELQPPDWDDAALMSRVSRIRITADELDDPGEAAGIGPVRGEAVTWLESGYPVRALELRCSPGERDNPIWIRELIYEDGRIAAGRRSFRHRSDDPSRRIWELYERYEGGRLIGLAWDPGMSGSPAYLKDWALKSYLEIQAWDIDADGWMDARRFLIAGDRVSSAELFITEASSDDLLPWRPGDWRPWE